MNVRIFSPRCCAWPLADAVRPSVMLPSRCSCGLLKVEAEHLHDDGQSEQVIALAPRNLAANNVLGLVYLGDNGDQYVEYRKALI